jgi:hypothetical protein
MSDLNKIIWLASYPKSGNTWFRIFLANLFSNSNAPVNINNLHSFPIASSRDIFDEIAGVSSSDLTFGEIEEMRPEVYEHLAANLEMDVYIKIHDAFTHTPSGKLLVSEKASKKAIYIIRNPLDVAVSFAHHEGVTFDRIIEIMNSQHYAFCNSSKKLNFQMQQRLLTWSSHVSSWTEQRVFPVKVFRYEDMINDTFTTFREAVQFLELNFGDQEIEKGFREKSPASESFFRKGKTGSWKEELTSAQAEKIISQHSDMMKKFGYLDGNGRLVY